MTRDEMLILQCLLVKYWKMVTKEETGKPIKYEHLVSIDDTQRPLLAWGEYHEVV